MSEERVRGESRNPHAARTAQEELDDVEKVIEQAGCSRAYFELEVGNRQGASRPTSFKLPFPVSC